MSTVHPIQASVKAAEVPAVVGILFNLPEHLQTVQILRALAAAELAGYQRCASESDVAALSRIRLSSSRPS
jgi:hypothetical protein